MSAVYALREEIEKINGDAMRSFVVDALTIGFDQDETEIESSTVRKIVRVARIITEELDVTDRLMDIVTAAAILHSMHNEDRIGALRVRTTLFSLQSNIGLEDFDMVMKLIEGQHGIQSPIPQVEPQLDEPIYVWILPLAIRLAKEVGA